MCSGVSGWCAPADVEPQSWWIRYTSIPPRAQMVADGATFRCRTNQQISAPHPSGPFEFKGEIDRSGPISVFRR